MSAWPDALSYEEKKELEPDQSRIPSEIRASGYGLLLSRVKGGAGGDDVGRQKHLVAEK